MKFAFLPNYFKKIGLICFFASIAIIIVGSVLIIANTPISSITTEGNNTHSAAYQLGYRLGYQAGQEIENYTWLVKAKNILLLLSMSLYMLAKEKVDDEYMDSMRWQSLRLSLIIVLAVAIVAIFLGLKLSGNLMLVLLFICYLITYKIKKLQVG